MITLKVTKGDYLMITVDELREAMPQSCRSFASQELADRINNMVAEPEVAQQIRENFISYAHVLADSRYRVDEYLNAVTYVSFKIMGLSNQESWKHTFPQKYHALVLRGADEKEISAYVASFNKGKLVNLVLERSLVPSWVLNQDLYQEAINVSAKIMKDVTVSAKVRVEAANNLMTQLKKPEKIQVEMDIGPRVDEGVQEMRDTLAKLAQAQQDLIAQGVSTRQIAHQKLGAKIPDVIEGTVEEVFPAGK